MKLMIIHLSDMHFEKKQDFKKENINAIVGALQESIIGIGHIMIIVSGDITFSGKKDECIVAANFFQTLKQAIILRYKVQDIRYIMVPGNHDMDYKKGNLSRNNLEIIESENAYEANLPFELIKQEEFNILANRFNCGAEKELVNLVNINYEGKVVQINQINTAVFSSLDEDQGFHYVTANSIEKLTNQTDADYVISIMHHPHHWYNNRCKKELEKALYNHSDLIYVGHEHYESTMKVESLDASVNILAAGELSNKGDWSKSEFHIAILDMDSREFISRAYKLNMDVMVYVGSEPRKILLSKDRYNKLGLTVRHDYLKELNYDKYAISESNQDFFVFPLLEEECVTDDKSPLPREISTMFGFMKELERCGKIIINGAADTGKSILAKAVFRELSKSKVTLFINGSDINNSHNNHKAIWSTFADIYSSDKAKYEAFKQMPREEVAIVIDDVDFIDERIRDEFLEYIDDRFGMIVETCQMEIDVDIKSRLRRRAERSEFSFFKIAPFYSNKRKELVGNIVRRILIDDSSQNRIIELLCEALTKQKYLYSLNPEFIVQFTKYYCNNIGDGIQNDGSVFSKVFESNIVTLIKPYARKMTVDKIMVLLDKIAYFIYLNKKYPIDLSDIDSTLGKYTKEYGGEAISTQEFINTLTDARILIYDDKSNGYKFYDRNYLAYFTAREIKRECLENNKYEQFERVMNSSYMGINADILLFLTYITDNLKIIKMLMQRGIEAVNKWSEFEIGKTDISFLTKSVEDIIKPVDKSEIEHAEEKRVEQEKNEVKSIVVANDATIFDDESDELDEMQELMRGISFMIILARTLPSFEHIMKKEDKDECVRLIYEMPLRIFGGWAHSIDDISGELIQEIKNFHEWEYRKEKQKYIPLEDSEALGVLRWESISMLLELMNVAIDNAARVNTFGLIDSFDYNDKPSYGVEHLMSLKKQDYARAFIDEAEKLIKNKNSMVKTMVRRVARNYMVNSENLKSAEIQSMNSKLFDQNISDSRILLEKQRNKKRK